MFVNIQDTEVVVVPNFAPKGIDKLFQTMLTGNFRQAVKYVSPTLTVKVTRRVFKYCGRKPDKRDSRADFVVTIGSPGYLERKFIKLALKAGEPFPIKKVQVKPYIKC